MKSILFLIGIIILIGIEIVSVYYIMPFPGSQVDEMVEVAHIVVGGFHFGCLFGVHFRFLSLGW